MEARRLLEELLKEEEKIAAGVQRAHLHRRTRIVFFGSRFQVHQPLLAALRYSSSLQISLRADQSGAGLGFLRRQRFGICTRSLLSSAGVFFLLIVGSRISLCAGHRIVLIGNFRSRCRFVVSSTGNDWSSGGL